MEFLRRRLGLILRSLISVALLFWLIRKIDWARLAGIVPTLELSWLLLATLGMLPVFFLNAWRWQILLKPHQLDLSILRSFELCMIGQFFNALLIGTTGGDIARIYYAARAMPQNKIAVVLTVLIDRAIGLVTLLGAGLVLMVPIEPFLFSTPLTRYACLTFIVFAILGLVGMFLAPFLPAVFAHGLVSKLIQRLPYTEKTQQALQVYRVCALAWRANINSFLISLLTHLVALLQAYALMRALHLPINLYVFSVIFMVISFLVALPTSISGLGVREVLFVKFFGLLQIDTEHATFFSLTYYAITLVWSLIGGLIYLLYRHETHAPAPTATSVLADT